jgi:hypothetical protein
MKFFKIAILLAFIGTKCFAINDIKQLKATVNSFGQQLIMDSSHISDEFLLTYDEFKSCYKLQNEKELDEQKILKNFENYYQANITNLFKNVKYELGQVYSILSFDTLQYSEIQSKKYKLYFIDISIVFNCKRRSKANIDSTRTLFKFVILNGKLKLTGQYRQIDYFEFTSHKLDIIQNQRKREFYIAYDEKYFQYSFYKCIPFRKNNKWGLTNFNNEILLNPVYDSIYPFNSNYALVVIGKKYNLVDTSFRLMFKQNKARIKFRDGKYYVLTTGNKYDLFPFIKQTEYDYLSTNNYADKKPKKEDLLNQLLNKYYNGQINDYSIGKKYESDSKKNSHYIIDNKTKDTLSILYGFSYIDSHAEFLYGVKEESYYVMNSYGKVLFQSKYICHLNAPGYVDVFDVNNYLFGIYCPYTNVYVTPKYLFIEPVDRDKFFIVLTKNGKLGYLDKNGKELF